MCPSVSNFSALKRIPLMISQRYPAAAELPHPPSFFLFSLFNRIHRRKMFSLARAPPRVESVRGKVIAAFCRDFFHRTFPRTSTTELKFRAASFIGRRRRRNQRQEETERRKEERGGTLRDSSTLLLPHCTRHFTEAIAQRFHRPRHYSFAPLTPLPPNGGG